MKRATLILSGALTVVLLGAACGGTDFNKAVSGSRSARAVLVAAATQTQAAKSAHLSLHASFGKPAERLPRIPNENHHVNWVDAAKGKTAASCPFDYAAKLTEVMLLGVVALRAGKRIEYDAANMRVKNVPAANQYLEREARPGWSV